MNWWYPTTIEFSPTISDGLSSHPPCHTGSDRACDKRETRAHNESCTVDTWHEKRSTTRKKKVITQIYYRVRRGQGHFSCQHRRSALDVDMLNLHFFRHLQWSDPYLHAITKQTVMPLRMLPNTKIVHIPRKCFRHNA